MVFVFSRVSCPQLSRIREPSRVMIIVIKTVIVKSYNIFMCFSGIDVCLYDDCYDGEVHKKKVREHLTKSHIKSP